MLPDVVLRYADHDDAVVDLHLPDRIAAVDADRVVVLVHGGFWKAEWDRRHTRPLARALADRGLLVATPEYRRVRAGGGWPVTGEDVHRALGLLPRLLASVGLRSAPLVVAGHSAGGHLALWLASTGLPLARVVALAPVCDLAEAVRLHLGTGATRALLGDLDPSVADPMVLLADRPATEVHLVHGTDDEDVPVSLSRGFAAAHPWADLHVLPGVGHMDLIRERGPEHDLLVDLLTRDLPATGAGP